MLLHICDILKEKNSYKRDQTGGYQRQRVEGELEEGGNRCKCPGIRQISSRDVMYSMRMVVHTAAWYTGKLE